MLVLSVLLLAMLVSVQGQLSAEDLREQLPDAYSAELASPADLRARRGDISEELQDLGEAEHVTEPDRCKNAGDANATCGREQDERSEVSTETNAAQDKPFEPSKHPNWRLFDHDKCGSSHSDRIIGGTEADMGAYPWIARVGYINKDTDIPVFKCGAALVNHFYFLTAAHCVVNLPNKMRVGAVRLGEHNILTDPDCTMGHCSDPVQDYKPAEIVVHKNYGKPQFKHDIALIRADREIKYTSWIKPICLMAGPQMNKSFVGYNVDVAGWGVYNMKNPRPSTKLQTIKLTVVKNEMCVSSFRSEAHVSDTQMCVGGEADRDSCSGDSGGPLMYPDMIPGRRQPQYFVIGVVSFGAKKCGQHLKPGVYTRLSVYMRWFMDNVRP